MLNVIHQVIKKYQYLKYFIIVQLTVFLCWIRSYALIYIC